MKRLIVAAMAACLLAQPVLAQHGDEADVALKRGLTHRDGGDAALAAHWLGVAAARGVPEAMFLLANMLLEGDGVPKDEAAARRWLEQATQLDYPEAWQQLGMMERDPEKAAQYFRRAAHALTHRAEGKR
ncbi:tetratricopeptide repeat protein [Massilia sp.]|uniref:tetratricopeptide repeat protein n=1 Tax=Massilia sp. TaxID=1882437 RepID=UPI00391B5057